MNDSAQQPVAVVTGAARGIGLAIAKWFTHQGYRVAMVDIEADALSHATQGMSQAQTMGVVCDVSDEAAVTRCAEQVMANWGRVDALVNNAGVASFATAAQTTAKEWRDTINARVDACRWQPGQHRREPHLQRAADRLV